MISAPDRKRAVRLINETVDAGARTGRACTEMGISMRTFQRWTQEGEVKIDGRPGGRTMVQAPTPDSIGVMLRASRSASTNRAQLASTSSVSAPRRPTHHRARLTR